MKEGQVKKQGGIQPGTTAYDVLSKKLNKGVNTASRLVFEELTSLYPDLVYKVKLSKAEIQGEIGACEPDGGIWYYKGMIIAAFEGKKQNKTGNAGERWFDNHFSLRKISKNITYVTFCAGSGSVLVYENDKGRTKKDGGHYSGGLFFSLHKAHTGDDGCINQFKPGVNNLYNSVDGFTVNQMADIIRETVIESIKFFNNVQPEIDYKSLYEQSLKEISDLKKKLDIYP